MSNKTQNKVLIVESPYYQDISKLLLEGATGYLAARDIAYEVVQVAGALEIPGAIAYAAQSPSSFDAYVALGCIVRGETYHFDIVANESARGLMDLTVRQHLPIGNGILTVENYAQALCRADPAQLNKGYHAAMAAVLQLELYHRLTNLH